LRGRGLRGKISNKKVSYDANVGLVCCKCSRGEVGEQKEKDKLGQMLNILFVLRFSYLGFVYIIVWMCKEHRHQTDRDNHVILYNLKGAFRL